MNSSRLHQETPGEVIVLSDKSPAAYRNNRNQSEPAPSSPQLEHALDDVISSNNATNSFSNVNQVSSVPTNVTPLSRRSNSSFTMPRDAPVPRLCRVRAYEEQLGFTVSSAKNNKGIFKVNDIMANSPAAHSGLLNEDYIIEISGRPVESMDYNDVVRYIKVKKTEDDLQLLVADKATLNWYKTKKIQISSQIIPKMQYIETLLKDELQSDPTYNSESK